MRDDSLSRRKDDHLDIVLDPTRAHRQVDTGLEAVRFAHCAAPELRLERIDCLPRWSASGWRRRC